MIENKICNTCRVNKNINSFYRDKYAKDGLQYRCKDCDKLQNKEFKLKNKNHTKDYNKKYWKNNKEKLILNNKNYRERNKEKLIQQKKEYYIENKEIIQNKKAKRYKYKYNNDSFFRLKENYRNGIIKAFKFYLKGDYKKSKRTSEIIGCSLDKFKKHIESQWEDWMNWENYGKYNGELKHGWDLDHIIPISSAELEEDLYRLNHYTNFQPLCSKVNRDVKKNK